MLPTITYNMQQHSINSFLSHSYNTHYNINDNATMVQ